MSKSTGNFMTLSEALETFGADAMRFCLADSGDSVDDANFIVAFADTAILRLYAFLEWAKEFTENYETYRKDNTKEAEDLMFQDSYFVQWVFTLLNNTNYLPSMANIK